MNPSARITVTTGPDRGHLLEVVEETAQIGKAPDCALVLNDPSLDEQQLCITRRGGRHAIFVSGTDEIEVDGTRIPPDRWVWLPQTASIQVTRRTTLEFVSLLTVSEQDYESVAPPAPAAGGKSPEGRNNGSGSTSSTSLRRAGGKGDTKSGTRTKAVARFITDQAGDPLVKLGADGHLPDLALQEGTAVVPQKNPADQQSNSMTLVIVFVVSVGMSLAMLFLDAEGPTGSAWQAQVARKALPVFYGTETAPLETYQQLLRRANWAHSQGDYDTETKLYRDVLKMLRAENKNSITGLTRLPVEATQKFNELTIDELKALNGPTDQFQELKNDDKLERLLSLLLKDR